ncbi:MAG: helix-turn-helix domain-containing protein [Christensenellales bacterium]
MENEESFKKIVAKQLVKYRKQNNLTQAELANKINYSDKAVSKWERGEALPDLYILNEIAKLYNISLQDIVSEESKTTTSPVMESKLTNRFKFFIGLSSCILVLFIATFIYAVLFALKVDTSKAYLVFLYAIPVTCIVGLVFNWIWGNVLNNFWFASGISWGLIIAIYYTLNIKELWLLFVATAVFQVLIIVWFLQIKTKIQKEKLAKTNEKDSITNQITINDQNF